MNNIASVTRNQCVGCKACGDICPQKAITYKIDEEGFWYPIINEKKCVDCGLCKKTCPCIQNLPDRQDELKSYMAWSRTPEVRDASTSGGIFYELAKSILDEGGVVVGARYSDDYKAAFHVVIDSLNTLNLIMETKYLQSDTEDIYNKVFDYLCNGKSVLFTGTPCQCAAITSFLYDRVSTENLYLMDFVCNSIYSPLVYRKWLEEWELKEKSKVVRVRAKSKKYGWTNRYWEIEFVNGKTVYVSDEKGENLYIAGIQYYDLYQRNSCYDCKFREEHHRAADITVGDFWGDNKQSQYDLYKGMSFVIANSNKGKKIFDRIRKRLFVKTCRIENIKYGQPRMLNNPICNSKRREFFELLGKEQFSKALVLCTGYQTPKMEFEIKNLIKLIKRRDVSILKYIHLNFLCKKIVRKGTAKIIPYKNAVINIDKNATIILEGDQNFEIGKNKLKGSKVETYLRIGKDAKLILLHGADMCYGSTLEIMNNGKLKTGFFTMNTGTIIVVDYEMEFGEYVGFGRNNLVYDSDFHMMLTSSGHQINRPRKVCIGDHVWMPSNITILPGANIGDNVIITPKSTIKHMIPSNSIYKDGKSAEFLGWWSDKHNNKYLDILKNHSIIMVGFGKEGKMFYARNKEKIEYIIDNASSDERTIKFKDFVKKEIECLNEKYIFVITSSRYYEKLYLMVRNQYKDALIISGDDI